MTWRSYLPSAVIALAVVGLLVGFVLLPEDDAVEEQQAAAREAACRYFETGFSASGAPAAMGRVAAETGRLINQGWTSGGIPVEGAAEQLTAGIDVVAVSAQVPGLDDATYDAFLPLLGNLVAVRRSVESRSGDYYEVRVAATDVFGEALDTAEAACGIGR